jgi:hypothetical protein
MDLRYFAALANTNACDAQPLEGDLGIPNARLIAPGNANASLSECSDVTPTVCHHSAHQLLIRRTSPKSQHGLMD